MRKLLDAAMELFCWAFVVFVIAFVLVSVALNYWEAIT